MDNIEFMRRARAIATYPTLYVMGGFGCRLGKDWYRTDSGYNKTNAAKIEPYKNTNPLTFGFDCVCLVKGILWGFTGDEKKENGGSKYESNGVPDYSVKQMKAECTDISSDFDEDKLVEGELVFLKDNSHVGIYVGNGEVIESTPAWKGCVQKTLLPSRNSSNYEKLPVRKWDYHGKSKYITYKTKTTAAATTPAAEVALAALTKAELSKAQAEKQRDEAIAKFNAAQTKLNNIKTIVTSN